MLTKTKVSKPPQEVSLSLQQLQQLLMNVDEDKSFKISAGSFIVLVADQHEVLCRSCGREVGNFELKLN